MITLSLDHYKMSQEWEDVTKYIDIAFTAIFGLEAIFKLIGMRYHYFRDAFNVFDFIVVIISTSGRELKFELFIKFSIPLIVLRSYICGCFRVPY